MPWTWPSSDGFDESAAAVTDEANRRSVVLPHAARVLYGSGRSVRLHLSEVEGAVLDCPVDGVELLPPPIEPAGSALLVVHVRLAADRVDPVERIPRLADVAAGRAWNARADLEALVRALVPAGRLRDGPTDRAAYVVTHATFDAGADAEAALIRESEAPAFRQWSRLLASAGPISALGPELLGRDPLDEDVDISASWSATVLRSGAAFVTRTPPSDSFHARGAALVRSIYLDALLLARVQREVVADLTARLSAVLDGARLATELQNLRRRLVTYRAGIWTEHLAESRIMNRLLAVAQEHDRIAEQQRGLADDIDDLSQLARLDSEQRVTVLLNVLVAVSVGVGLAALVFEPGWPALLCGVVLSSALAGVIWWAQAVRASRLARLRWRPFLRRRRSADVTDGRA